MKTSDFDYELPEKFIAQTAVEPRSSSKLLIYNRNTNSTSIEHFYNIVDYLKKGDVVVINTTRVMNARLYGEKKSGSKFEVLLLKEVSNSNKEYTYEVLIKPLKRLRLNEKIFFNKYSYGELLSKNIDSGTAMMHFNFNPQELGTMPLPHYIKENKQDNERYQTVYSNVLGSAAAPTAGLHWTPELIQKAKDKGVIFCDVLLHVGIGTFRPVKVENISEHTMHREYYEISQAAADIINKAKKENRRVICVGTTSVRTLESVFKKHKKIIADRGETDIFIYPPYELKVADALITNFHLPKSTLLMLVSAFVGREKVLELYELAKQENFRFFSFGDACFLC